MDEIIERNMEDPKPLNSACLWGDEDFADATIVMGDRTWKVHRWVLCKQSDYFMKAFEGHFVEGKQKKIDLTGNPFNADEFNSFLMFLYTKDDDSFFGTHLLRVYGVADYFQAEHLRYRALDCLRSYFQNFARDRQWRTYGINALNVSEQYPTGDIQQVVVEVTAKHVSLIMYEAGTLIWDMLKDAQPNFVGQVLRARCPKCHKGAHLCDIHMHFSWSSGRTAARAARASDDDPTPARSRPEGSHRCTFSASMPFRKLYYRAFK